MDIIAQLQEHASKIAYIAFNTVGTLQRDAPASQLFQDYPRPPAVSAEALATVNEQPKALAASLVQAVQQFDALVAALPITGGGEEAQNKRIAELQAENEEIGQELQREVDAAEGRNEGLTEVSKIWSGGEYELKQIQKLFDMAADNCLRMKSPQ